MSVRGTPCEGEADLATLPDPRPANGIAAESLDNYGHDDRHDADGIGLRIEIEEGSYDRVELLPEAPMVGTRRESARLGE